MSCPKTVLEEVLRGLVRRADVAGGRVLGFAYESKGQARPEAGKAKSCNCALFNFQNLGVREFFVKQCKRGLLAVGLNGDVVPSLRFAENGVEPEFHDVSSVKTPCDVLGHGLDVKPG